MPMSRAEMSVNQGTNDVYFPESNISIGKAIVNSEPASVKRGMFITAFSSEGYQPATNSPTMLGPDDSGSCVCWISAMKLNQERIYIA